MGRPDVSGVAGSAAVIAYWIAFIAPTIAVLSPLRATRGFGLTLWVAIGIYFSLFVGLRHEVGADWINYLIQFNSEGVEWSEPGYAAINLAFARMGLGIHFVNLVCATIFVAGLLSFCRREPLPWLAIAIAVPYLLIVVGMGYTKQAVSLGLLLWGLGRLQEGGFKTYVFAVLLATTFHASAIICLLFAALSARQRGLRFALVAMSLVMGILVVYVIQRYDALVSRLGVVGELESAGAGVRLAMSIIALCALLLFRKQWRRKYGSIELWAWMGGLSVLGLAALPFASTAVDRAALYFSPLQIVVWSRLPTLIAGRLARTQFVLSVLLGYAAVLGVWLTLGNNAQTWLPYQNVLTDWLPFQ